MKRTCLVATSLLSLILLAAPLGAVTINEIRIDQTGTDLDEYFELAGNPNESLTGLTYIVIGDATGDASGVIDAIYSLTGLTILADGFLAVHDPEPTPALCSGYDVVTANLNFENSDNNTHMLVTGFSGSANQDLDTNNDGVLDITPWTSIVDCVAIVGTSGLPVYCATQVGPDGSFVPGHVFLCGNQWVVGDFAACTNDTPGAANTPQCGNLSPDVFNLIYRPCAPTAGQQVTLDVAVTDANADVSTVRAFYKLSTSASFDSVNMVVDFDSLYTATLPGQANLSLVQFYVEARDANGNATRNPSSAPTFTRSYRVGIVTIASIQSSTVADTCLSSSLAGQAVNVEGIVTHRAFEYSDDFFYIQDGTSANSGIKVFAADSSFVPDIGDRVRISGFIEEFRCVTEVEVFADCGQVIGSGAVVPRTVTTVDELQAEENESMLVRLVGNIDVVTGFDTTIVGSATFVEFLVAAGGDTAWVGDDTFFPDGIGYTPVPVPGQSIESLTGIVSSRFFSPADGVRRLRLEPRRDNDVDINWTDVGDDDQIDAVRVFQLGQNHPNPFNPVTTIAFEVPEAGTVHLNVFDANGRLVRQLLAKQYFAPTRDRVTWNGLDEHGNGVPSGLYFYQLEASGRIATRKMLLLK